MSRAARGKSAASYRTIGKTYDGVTVVAPKTKSKRFTEAEVRKIVSRAIQDLGGAASAKSLTTTDAPRVEKRSDGSFSVKRVGKKKASAVVATQKDAVARARELEPGKGPIVKRVRKSPEGKRGTWRKA